MSLKPQRVTTRYYQCGPRPFSGYSLTYKDNYVMELMLGVRAWQAAVGLAQTMFGLYTLTKDPNTERYIFRRGPIATYALSSGVATSALYDALIWDARNTDDLRDAGGDAIEHARRVAYDGISEITYPAYASGALAGYGKTIGGNYVLDIMAALNALLADQSLTLSWWIVDFKELATNAEHIDAIAWAYGWDSALVTATNAMRPGDVVYNLTTDHVELCRVWPRSCVLICDRDNHLGLLDARLDDRDSAGNSVSLADKVARWYRPTSHDDSALIDISKIRAVLWSDPSYPGYTLESRGRWYYICADVAEGKTWIRIVSDTYTQSKELSTVAIDACVRSSASEWDYLHVLNSDKTITTFQATSAAIYAQYTSNVKRCVAAMDVTCSAAQGTGSDVVQAMPADVDDFEPAGICVLNASEALDVAWYWPGSQYDENYKRYAEWQAGRMLALADASKARILLCAYNAGGRDVGGLVAGSAYYDYIRVVGEVPIGDQYVGWKARGVTAETDDGTPKEGPFTRWRLLAGRAGTHQIQALDIYSDYPDEVRFTDAQHQAGNALETREEGRAPYIEFSRASSFYYDDGKAVDTAPWPDYAIRFAMPAGAAALYSIFTVELYRTAQGGEVHALLAYPDDLGDVIYASTPRGHGNKLAHLTWTWPTNAQLNSLSAGISLEVIGGTYVFTVDPNVESSWATVTEWTIPATLALTIGGSPHTATLGDWSGISWLCCALDATEGLPRWVIATYYTDQDDAVGQEWAAICLDDTELGCHVPGTEWLWYAYDGGSWLAGGSATNYRFDGGQTDDQNLTDWTNTDTPELWPYPVPSGAYIFNVRKIGTGLYAGYSSSVEGYFVWQLGTRTYGGTLEYTLLPQWMVNLMWQGGTIAYNAILEPA